MNGGIDMKDKFIRFLKDRHCFDEYKEEILPFKLGDLTIEFESGGAEFLINDGAIFFWKHSMTDVDWKKLNDEWVGLVREHEKLQHGGKMCLK